LATSASTDRRNVDADAWTQLVGRDSVAAAIEAATHDANRRK
jgi:hypothetical protein